MAQIVWTGGDALSDGGVIRMAHDVIRPRLQLGCFKCGIAQAVAAFFKADSSFPPSPTISSGVSKRCNASKSWRSSLRMCAEKSCANAIRVSEFSWREVCLGKRGAKSGVVGQQFLHQGCKFRKIPGGGEKKILLGGKVDLNFLAGSAVGFPTARRQGPHQEWAGSGGCARRAPAPAGVGVREESELYRAA